MTLTERVWQLMDGNKTGLVDESDARAVAKKYKKSLPENIVSGIIHAFKENEARKHIQCVSAKRVILLP